MSKLVIGLSQLLQNGFPMRPRSLVLVLTVLLCILGTIPIVLLSTLAGSNSPDNSSTAVISHTVGIILADAAAIYGWNPVGTAGDGFGQETLEGHRAIVFAGFNHQTTASLSLTQVVDGLLQRGVQHIFVSPNLTSAETGPLPDSYPHIGFTFNVARRADVVPLLASLPQVSVSSVPTATVAATAPSPAPASERSATNPLPVFVVLTGLLLTGILLRVWWRTMRLGPESGKRKKRPGSGGLHHRRLAIQDAAEQSMTRAWDTNQGAPFWHKLTTYVQGDARYDDSFSIELPDMGEFLGQYGVTVAAPVTRYSPDRATALEVWLFDQKDIRTVNTILASDHAFSDHTLREDLRKKAETDIRLIQQDLVTTLETNTLRLQARVLALQYGVSDTLPVRSVFDHVVLELAIWRKIP